MTWVNGAVTSSAADAFVADAFSGWTGVSKAAVKATRGGQIAEDVSGANVILNADRTITLPTDIQPTAIDNPIAVVYDADGTGEHYGGEHGNTAPENAGGAAIPTPRRLSFGLACDATPRN